MPGVKCQERTRAELLDTLELTLREALELNRHDALDATGQTFEEAPNAYEAVLTKPAPYSV